MFSIAFYVHIFSEELEAVSETLSNVDHVHCFTKQLN
jgi:hypothetical protein